MATMEGTMKVKLTVETPKGDEFTPDAKFGDVEMAVEFARKRATGAWWVYVGKNLAAEGVAGGKAVYR
jgi:hypothetical protein